MPDRLLVLPPRVAAAVHRARPGLASTLLRGPLGGWTWLAPPALAVASQGRSPTDALLLVAGGAASVLLLHGGTWMRRRAAAARDPRVPVLLGLERTLLRLNRLLPRARIWEAEAAAGLHGTNTDADTVHALRRGLDGLAHALGRALSQQPEIGHLRSGWRGSLGGLDGFAQDLKRLAGRVSALEALLNDTVVHVPQPEQGTVLFFKRPD